MAEGEGATLAIACISAKFSTLAGSLSIRARPELG